jgi:hypothetical protein
MINNALGAAYTTSGIGGTAPYYFYNPETELISLFVDSNDVIAGNTVFVNKYLKNYLNSFNYYFDNTTRNVNYLYFMNYVPNPPVVGGMQEFKQEYVSMSLWLDIKTIQIVSNSLPIVNESVPDQFTTQTSQYPIFTGVNSSTPIISDFAITYDNANMISSDIVYNPTAQYRLVSLVGNTPLSTISLEFRYTDRYGNVFPINFDPSNCISVKIAFLKKSLFKK